MRAIDLQHMAWAKSGARRHRFGLANSSLATPDLAGLGLPCSAALPVRQGDAEDALEHELGMRWKTPGGRVLLAAGTSEANACVFAGMLSPGDQVLVERPGYEPHRVVPTLFGAEVRSFARPAPGDSLADQIEPLIDRSTRMIVVSHLHNPSAAPLASADLEALDRLAELHDLMILADEVYRDAAPGVLGCFASRGPRWITTSSLTKAYGLGGLRIGWVAGSPETLEHCRSAQHAMSAEVAHPSVALALSLSGHLDTLRTRAHRILDANRLCWNAMVERLAGYGRAVPFQLLASGHGVTIWCVMGEGDLGDRFAGFASQHFDLGITRGSFFGDPRGVRVSLGAEPPRFAEALEQLERALAAFSETEAGRGVRS